MNEAGESVVPESEQTEQAARRSEFWVSSFEALEQEMGIHPFGGSPGGGVSRQHTPAFVTPVAKSPKLHHRDACSPEPVWIFNPTLRDAAEGR